MGDGPQYACQLRIEAEFARFANLIGPSFGPLSGLYRALLLAYFYSLIESFKPIS